jgi:predicted ester cyclase
MSAQTDSLRELVLLLNAGKAIDVARFFTEDFRLEDPGVGVKRTGHDGARQMLEAIRALAPDVKLEILDMFESGNRVAIRWRVTVDGNQDRAAMIAIYQFDGNRIARDWGISVRSPWTD